MSDNRTFPDIVFVDTNTEEIANEMISRYEEKTGRTLYAADPVRALLLYIASAIAQERIMINEAAKMNVPRYATGNYLDSLCEIFKDVSRLPAEAATVTLRFTISEAQETATLVPAGTRVNAADGVVFATKSDCNIIAGDTYADVTAQCLTLGTIGNGFTAGQINEIVDIFPFFSSVANTDTSSGGADVESDLALYERMRESVETYSTAGPSENYIYHAKSVSASIVDVTATSTTGGVVDVRILCSGGTLPSEDIINKVTAALNDEKVRPLTDSVNISAPTEVSFDINFTYYIAAANASAATEITDAIEEAVEKYKLWQSEKIGRDINPSYLIQLVMEAGAKRVVITSPEYTAISSDSVAIADTTTITSGGTESE